MYMTDREIVRSYKQADTKREQITILSELNACDHKKIEEVLKRNGIIIKKTRSLVEMKKYYNDIIDMRHKGMILKDIANIYGSSTKTIWNVLNK